jgi:hypothetical protein
MQDLHSVRFQHFAPATCLLAGQLKRAVITAHKLVNALLRTPWGQKSMLCDLTYQTVLGVVRKIREHTLVAPSVQSITAGGTTVYRHTGAST